jgi:hypothetical protein
MWRPLEVFLYDWWPIRQEAQLYDRLSAMPVRIIYKDDTRPDAWRSDWPVAAPAVKTLADKAPSSPLPVPSRTAAAPGLEPTAASMDRASDPAGIRPGKG